MKRGGLAACVLLFALVLGCRYSSGGGGDNEAPAGLAASPAGGFYCSALTVNLTASKGSIYYTLDGSEPTTSSPVYNGPLDIDADAVVKFMAVDGSGNRSGTATQVYQIKIAPSAVNYLVITADGLAAEAEAIRAYREGTCYNTGLLTMSEIIAGMGGADVEAGIKSRIDDLYQTRDPEYPFYVLLVGDADPAPSLDPALIPAPEVWAANEEGKKDWTVSDNWYADLEGDDGIPDLALGRLPFRDPAQVALYLDKLMAYEGVYSPGEWNRRLSFFAGNPGFGEPLDSLIEQVAVQALDQFPYYFDMNMTYGNEKSAYFFVPEEFSDKVYERFNQGALAMIYIGHGAVTHLDDVNGEQIMDTADIDLLAPAGRPPIFIIIACWAGRFVGSADSLGEMVLKRDNGIPAVFASTEISHPAINAILSMLTGYHVFVAQPPTIGEGLRETKDDLVNIINDPQFDPIIDLLVQYQGVTEEEVAEMLVAHSHMYVLLGDPALAIPFPSGQIALNLDQSQYQAGGTVSVTGLAAAIENGQALVTLEVPRPVLAYPIAQPIDWGDPDVNEIIRTNYANANNKVLEAVTVNVVSHAFTTSFTLPAGLEPAIYHIKAYAYSDHTDMVGEAPFEVVP